MKDKISSQFKYTIDLGVNATKSAFRLKKTIKDRIVHCLVIAFIFIMAGMMIWDIVHDNSFTIDIIILVVLVGMEIFNLIMPSIIIHTQKKFLTKINITEMDYVITEISKDKCTESYYKDNKVAMQNSCDMSKLVAYEIKDGYAYIVFSNFACAIFDLNTLNITQVEFEQELSATIAKNNSLKTNRKP